MDTNVTSDLAQGKVDSAVAPAAPDEHSANLGRSVRRGALWSAASTLTVRFANISIMAVVARTLTPRDFGVFAIALAVHAIVSSIAEIGVASCLMRGDVDMDRVAPTVATVSLISSSILAGLMFVFARPLAGALGSVDAADPMRALAFVVFLVGVFAVPGAELARNFQQQKIFAANMVGFVFGNSVLLVLALHGGGAMSFAWSRVVGQLAVGLTITAMVGRWRLPGMDGKALRFVLAFGLPLAGANLLNYALLNTDYVFIGHLLGPIELGVYMLAFNVAGWSTSLLSAVLNSVAMPAFSRVKQDPSRLQHALERAAGMLAFIALPFCALAASLAKPLIETVYGTRWDAAAPVLGILAGYGAISVLCLLFANVLSGIGQTKALLIAQIPWICVLVPGMALGIHLGGIVGAAWAHIVVVCLVALPIYLALLRRVSTVRIFPILCAIFPFAAAAGLCALVALLVSHLVEGSAARLLLGGLAGGLCYLAVVFPALPTVLGATFDRLPVRATRLIYRYAGLYNRYGSMSTRIGYVGRHTPTTMASGPLLEEVD